MSENTTNAPAAPETNIELEINGVKHEFTVVTLTKGKGKGRTVLVPAAKYSTDIDALIGLIKSFPKCVALIYKDVFRAPALAASVDSVKSVDNIDIHAYNEGLESEWSVTRQANPLKQLEEEIRLFKEENADIEEQLIINSSDLPNIRDRANSGDADAAALVARLTDYSAQYRAKMAKLNKLRREAEAKKAKKASK